MRAVHGQDKLTDSIRLRFNSKGHFDLLSNFSYPFYIPAPLSVLIFAYYFLFTGAKIECVAGGNSGLIA